ncbi:hypothetical protein ScalyP_jg3995 [Parmales sp. scaly parma]|nr:hypothetical protein ScalyP_jg3995 [Parmales sp. scaly parma]
MYSPSGAGDALAIVAEIGSYTSKVGFSGNDSPSSYFSSIVACPKTMFPDDEDVTMSDHVPTPTSTSTLSPFSKLAPHFTKLPSTSQQSQSEITYRSPFTKSRNKKLFNINTQTQLTGTINNSSTSKISHIESFELYVALLTHGINETLGLDHNESAPPDLSDHPLLLSLPSALPSSDRAALTNFVFKTYPTLPAIYLSKDATLACYAVGKSSGTVVDIGGSGVRVSCVYEGWVEEKKGGALRGYKDEDNGGVGWGGGEFFDALWGESVKELEKDAKSKASLPNVMKNLSQKEAASFPNDQDSFQHRAHLEDMRNGREEICKVADFGYDETDEDNETQNLRVPYILPDGSSTNVGSIRFNLGETLFSSTSPSRKDFPTLQSFLTDTVWTCDRDHHVALLSNVILTGGGSAMDGLPERLRAEIEAVLHVHTPMWRVKVLAAQERERKFGSWIGGSILTSLAGFAENWVSRREWEEQGGETVNLKCP